MIEFFKTCYVSFRWIRLEGPVEQVVELEFCNVAVSVRGYEARKLTSC